MPPAPAPVTAAPLSVDEALALAYVAFAPVPRPRSLHGSPLRNVDKILRDTTAAPLRQLTHEQLGLFASSAITTASPGRCRPAAAARR